MNSVPEGRGAAAAFAAPAVPPPAAEVDTRRCLAQRTVHRSLLRSRRSIANPFLGPWNSTNISTAWSLSNHCVGVMREVLFEVQVLVTDSGPDSFLLLPPYFNFTFFLRLSLQIRDLYLRLIRAKDLMDRN